MIETKLLSEFHAAVGDRVADLDEGVVRRAFAELMDRSAAAALAAGLDLDDVLLERYAVMRDVTDAVPRQWTIPLTRLGDRDHWLAQFDRCRVPDGARPCDPDATEIVALKLRVLLEIGVPRPGTPPQRPGS